MQGGTHIPGGELIIGSTCNNLHLQTVYRLRIDHRTQSAGCEHIRFLIIDRVLVDNNRAEIVHMLFQAVDIHVGNDQFSARPGQMLAQIAADMPGSALDSDTETIEIFRTGGALDASADTSEDAVCCRR